MGKPPKYGSGWHKQSARHSRAKKTGRAGGTYSTEKRRLYDSKGREIMTRKEERAIQSALRYKNERISLVDSVNHDIKGHTKKGEPRNNKNRRTKAHRPRPCKICGQPIKFKEKNSTYCKPCGKSIAGFKATIATLNKKIRKLERKIEELTTKVKP